MGMGGGHKSLGRLAPKVVVGAVWLPFKFCLVSAKAMSLVALKKICLAYGAARYAARFILITKSSTSGPKPNCEALFQVAGVAPALGS